MSDPNPNPNADSVTIRLTKPIRAHGETLSELTLRPPTVKELRSAGSPFKGSGTGAIAPDYEACANLLSMICAIPHPSVDELAARDFNLLSMTLVGFTVGATAEDMNSSSSPAP
ncbi:MAG: phage tail assembly protein [Stellaceae bacterium]